MRQSLSLLAGMSLIWLTGCLSTSNRPTGSATVDLLRRSLVRVGVTVQNPDYAEPWSGGEVGSGVGSGFVVSGKRIMTNAHVVSNARLLLLERDGDPRRYPARVVHVAHDCDLALIAPEDDSFFDNTVPLDFGPLPELHSWVAVYGYPIGGERMSVTRGVVSRIEFRGYSHSMLDSHLTIQIDAAINPGNSGGPVLQGDKVVGVAFQGYSGNVAQSIGYMIPTPVIQRFLADVEDGSYDGYVELAVYYQSLTNPAYRAALGLPNDDRGVVVDDVLDAGSAAGIVQRGDILLAIDGNAIYSDGTIRLDGDDTQLEEIVERKFHGDRVTFDLLRDGQKQRVEVPLKGAWPYHQFARHYDVLPRYIVVGGLVFQPLDRNLVEALDLNNVDLMYHFNFFVTNEIYKERPEVVILSTILPDQINVHVRHLAQSVVDEVNGIKIRRLDDVAAALRMPVTQHTVKLLNNGRPIVMQADDIRDAQRRIQRNYGVRADHYLGPREEAQP